jgi:hypothetical protein
MYPVKKLRDRIIEAHPVLALWGEPFDGHRLGWAELMYHESSAIQSAMFRLKNEGVASFPVHDSLIVPRSAESFAIQHLADAYHDEAGTESIALVVHSMDEPERHVVGRREVQEWELDDEPPQSGHSLTEPDFTETESEALHGAGEAEDEDDPFGPKEYDGCDYREDDDEQGAGGASRWSDPEAAYRAPPIEWLKQDKLPPGRSHRVALKARHGLWGVPERSKSFCQKPWLIERLKRLFRWRRGLIGLSFRFRERLSPFRTVRIPACGPLAAARLTSALKHCPNPAGFGCFQTVQLRFEPSSHAPMEPPWTPRLRRMTSPVGASFRTQPMPR